MSNMSYCRFQNTANDLSDCVENIRTLNPEHRNDNTDRERAARHTLIHLCAKVLDDMGVADIDWEALEYEISGMDDGDGFCPDPEDF